VLELARKKDYAGKQVAFEIADLYEFAPDKPFESLFGGFIWSHIPVQELNRFLATMKRLVVPGGTVVLMDNRYVEGSNLPITHSDEHGNTFQTRKLEDGSTHQVLKNFPSEVFLREQIEGRGGEMSYWKMEYYWLLSWTTP
jgi:demethylmenaquinone methyltransferase/2-methoxy-6-polyprenyl-1,4-benzoquinol methylase